MKFHNFLSPGFIKIIVCIGILTHICILHAQEEHIRFRHLTIEDGLSQNSALCIVQDNNGFIWIGTQVGLNKHDGYKFIMYECDDDNPASLSNSYISSFFKDPHGILWIGTEKGFNRFDPGTNQFIKYLHNPDDSNSLSNNTVFSICGDNSGDIWIATEDGLNRYNQENERFICYKTDKDNPNSISNNIIHSLCLDTQGVLWVGTDGGGLNKFDQKNELFILYQNLPGDSTSLSNDHVSSIFEDRSGLLWIGTDGGGLNKFDRETERFFSYKNIPGDRSSLSDNHVSIIYEDQSGALWIGTVNGGLNIFNRHNEKFYCYRNIPDNPNSFSGHRVTAIYEDNSGEMWIGTRDRGANIFNRKTQKFVHYKFDPYNTNSLNDKMVWCIYEDLYGILWIGTDVGGLNKYDQQKGEFKHYGNNPDDPNSLSHNRVHAIIEDKSGILWIGTGGGGLNKFDRAAERFVRYKNNPENPHSLSSNKVVCIYEDRSGTLWIGTKGGGLNKFNRETEQFVHYKFDPNDPHSLGSNRAYAICEDRSGVLWVGTFGGGLNKFDRKNEQWIRFQSDPEDSNSLSDNFILSLYEDKSGNFWIGTINEGLNKFNPSNNTFTHFTKKDGLPDNAIYHILEDNHGNFWLSTNKGMSKFNPATEEFQNYDKKDGLQSGEFNYGAGYKSISGKMFFGGINGFNSFYPDSIRDNPHIPPVVITDFQLFNKSVPIGKMADGRTILERSISETKEITLAYNDYVFSFEFAALHYAAPEENQYAYMMEGLEKEWNYVSSNRRYATYTRLPPRKYVFRVKGSNNDGVWNEEGTSIRITVLPPFWRTWWFYLFCAISIIFSAAAAYAKHITRLKREKEEEERFRVITDISHVLEQGSATVYRRNFDSDVYEYMGEGITDITGYRPSEFTFSFWDTIIISIEQMGEMKGLSLAEVFQHVREGKSNKWVSDIKFKSKSGEIRWLRDIATTLRDDSGRCYALLGIIFDITDRKKSEQILEDKVLERTEELIKEIEERKHSEKALQKEKTYLDELFESAHEAIVMCDKEHRVTRINREFTTVFGYTAEEALGQLIDDLIAPEDFKEEAESLTTRVGMGQKLNFETIRKRKDGTHIHVSVHASRIMIGKTQVGVYGIYRDISDRKQAEEDKKQLEGQLHQAQKMEAIGQLAGGVAHDFNNMLGGILGFADIILRKFTGNNTELEKYVNRIINTATRSAELTAKLLAFARKGKYEIVAVNVHKTIQTVISLFEHTIDKRITIVQNFSAHHAMVMGDSTQLQNAILNIAVNSLDAMPDGGDLTFTTDTVTLDKKDVLTHTTKIAPGPCLKISISDTGEGIDEETQAKIFEPFFTTKEIGKGTGLGLASVYGTIENHNGAIAVESTVGKGTTFTIHLPLTDTDAEESEYTPESIQKGSGTILLIDDENVIRETSREMLIELGYTVTTCKNGKEALEYYKKHHPKIDIVIMDVMMPELAGYDCFILLKEINPEIKVVVSSGYSIDGEARKILQEGALGFLQKPFTFEKLSTTISEALA